MYSGLNNICHDGTTGWPNFACDDALWENGKCCNLNAAEGRPCQKDAGGDVTLQCGCKDTYGFASCNRAPEAVQWTDCPGDSLQQEDLFELYPYCSDADIHGKILNSDNSEQS